MDFKEGEEFPKGQNVMRFLGQKKDPMKGGGENYVNTPEGFNDEACRKNHLGWVRAEKNQRGGVNK